MKEYLIVIIVSVGMFFLFRVLDKYKSFKFRFVSSIIGIIGFAAFFVEYVIRKKATIDNDMIVALLLVLALIIYLSTEVFKSYRQLYKK